MGIYHVCSIEGDVPELKLHIVKYPMLVLLTSPLEEPCISYIAIAVITQHDQGSL